MKTKKIKSKKSTEYRKAKRGDWKNIKALVSLYPKVLMQAHVPKWGTFFVAEDAGRIIGCCSLDIYSKRIAEVRSLVVLPPYQGRGIAKKLIQLCLDKAEKKGIMEVITITGKDTLFRKFGFSTFNKEKIALFKLMKE